MLEEEERRKSCDGWLLIVGYPFSILFSFPYDESLLLNNSFPSLISPSHLFVSASLLLLTLSLLLNNSFPFLISPPHYFASPSILLLALSLLHPTR